VGITRSQKKSLQSVLGAGVPEVIYLPSGAGRKADKLAVICGEGVSCERVCKELSLRLKELTGTEYAYKDLEVYKDSFLKISAAVSILAAALGGTALLVGGVGVMSNMAAAAESRRREIGIYVSQGASKKDVALLFLTESVSICLLGGLIAWCLCAALSALYIPDKFTFIKSGLVGIASSVLCGAVFGLIPALRAASLDPTDTIRE
ncbi:MAG: FtsX-like permease family protein, partial [Clostridia bacterium]|nr:FtsX-like permease family protein [Clostridia bacterium]